MRARSGSSSARRLLACRIKSPTRRSMSRMSRLTQGRVTLAKEKTMNNDLSRVRYTPRQFLGAQDFTDEQAYHLGMHRRHNIAHHTWGIVRGLELIVEDEDSLFVQPGFAVDGFGRELLLP